MFVYVCVYVWGVDMDGAGAVAMWGRGKPKLWTLAATSSKEREEVEESHASPEASEAQVEPEAKEEAPWEVTEGEEHEGRRVAAVGSTQICVLYISCGTCCCACCGCCCC